ncbi:cupin domain-containing protein [Aquabacterium sp. J223]|uniref:cupin domain-containing protein n=1 Tax=Aquabacterium sp. J223 TaxID=2898431 RepID=UPI0021AE1601|nr:cupin domain-containing protein [Aquabacterium sp. J223]UUX97247.1 cupin domain-containing protein [Aquabacterium sp. J223]
MRRIVTGHDDQGRSIVSSDGPAPSVNTNPKRVGYCLTELWNTDSTPAYVGNDPDPTVQRKLKLEPPPNGTSVRIIEFGPEGDWLQKIDAEGAKVAWGALGTDQASTNRDGRAKHPFMHRTESIDYALVLDGEITLVLDEQEVQMKAGDFLVERGTNHAWANRSGRPCRILFVLIDGRFDPEIARHF